jgi:hypothetical protein
MNIRLPLCSLLLLFTANFAFCEDPKSGDTVAAKWSDGFYYVATVNQVHDGKFDVLYADGDKATVSATDLIALSSAPLEVGAHVLAAWKTARMFPGVITAKTEQAYTIKWDDGDAPMDVVKNHVVPLAK